MPIVIDHDLPVRKILEKESIFVMTNERAEIQDIRPLEIAIVNLMPTKIETETQILRLLVNSPLQIKITLVNMKSRVTKNTAPEYLAAFYHTFSDIQQKHFDGMVITGAPVERMAFEEVGYWKELAEVMEFSKHHVTSTLHICWAAQAGLYYHYRIPKYLLPKKVFGVFEHKVLDKTSRLSRGFDDVFHAPHSRYTEVKRSDIEEVKEITIVSESAEAGVYIVESNDKKQVFVTGHSEYGPETLRLEYERDKERGVHIEAPKNYFQNDDPTQEILVQWRSHGSLLFSNWLNYYVYQETPNVLGEKRGCD